MSPFDTQANVEQPGAVVAYDRDRAQAALGSKRAEFQRWLMRFFLRCLPYAWALPYTLLGIAIGLLLCGRFQRVQGVIEIHGPVIAKVLSRLLVPAMAMTFGHVVFGRTAAALESTRTHERVHVRQYERWGIAFVPVYLLLSAVLYIRGRDGYRENPFEVEAYAVDSITSRDSPPAR